MLKNFPLPLCITDITHYELIESVRAHLEQLNIQMVAQELMNIFHNLGNIEYFSFEYYEEMGNATFIDLNHVKTKENLPNNDDDFNVLKSRLFHLSKQCPYFFRKLSDKIITQENIASLIIDALGQDYYQAWQDTKSSIEEASKLDASLLKINNKSNQKKI
jgi:hypothetical protein